MAPGAEGGRLTSITRRLHALAGAAVGLTAPRDITRGLDAAAAVLVRDLEALEARVWLASGDGADVLLLRSAAGAGPGDAPRPPASLDLADDDSSVAAAARTLAPTRFVDDPDDPDDPGAAALALPLVAGGALQGVLEVVFAGSPPPETIALLQVFAATLAVAVHDAALFASERAARARAEASERRFLGLVDGIDHAIVWEADPASMRFSFVSARTPPRLLRVERDEWLADPGFWEEHVHPADRERVRAALLMALETDKDQACEHRMLRKDGTTQWVHTGVRVVRDPASGRATFHGLTVDISHLKLAADLQERRVRAEGLRADVSAALAEAREAGPMLQRCALAVVRRLDASFARFWLLEPGGAELVLQASAGRYTHLDGAHARVPVGRLKIGRIAATRRPHVTNDVQHDPLVDVEWAAREGLVSFAGYPLVAEDRVVGVVAMFGADPLPDEAADALGWAADAIAQGVLRLRAERALREGEARLRLAIEATALGTWELDADERLLRGSPRARELLGVGGAAGVTRGRLVEAVDPDDRAALEGALTRALDPRGDGALSVEVRVIDPRRRGRRRWVVLRGRTVFDASPGAARRAVRIIGAALDVTESRHAAADARFLAEAGRQLAGSLDYEVTLRRVARLAVPYLAEYYLVDLLDEEGPPRLVAATHVGAAIEAEVRELRARRPIDPDIPLGAPLVLRTGEPDRRDVDAGLLELVGRADPERRSLMEQAGVTSYMVLPLAVRGRTLGTITLLAAESGRRYDAQDQVLGEELARRVAMALDNARLYREARGAVRARDEFLAIASHELRTPLTPLQLQVQSLRRMVGHPELPLERVRQKLEVAERQVQRLGVLVANLLDISRITGHRLLLEPEALDLVALTRDLVERSRDQLRRAGCDLELTAPQEPLVGRWDRVRVEQVLTNLLSNAMKYGAAAPVEVELAAEGDHARLTVRDHGIGIAPEDQRRVFQRFERAVSERHYGGFGLGLWICRQVVEAMGGTIALQSALGAGATFTVRLPLPGPRA